MSTSAVVLIFPCFFFLVLLIDSKKISILICDVLYFDQVVGYFSVNLC